MVAVAALAAATWRHPWGSAAQVRAELHAREHPRRARGLSGRGHHRRGLGSQLEPDAW